MAPNLRHPFRGMTLGALLLVAVGAIAGDAPAPTVLTLPEALRLSLKQNPDVILADLNQKIFETQYWQTVALGLPNISLTGTYQRNFKSPKIIIAGDSVAIAQNHGVSVAATATQALYAGGKVLTAIQAANKQRAIGVAETTGTQNTVFYGVKRLFFAVLFADDLVSIQTDNLKSTQEHLDTMRQRYKQGLESDLVVRRQEVEVANAKSLLLIATNLSDNRVMDLQDILALNVEMPLQIKGALKSPAEEGLSLSAFLQAALKTRPELLIAREKTQIALDLIAIAKGDMKPNLNLFGTYQWDAQFNSWPPTGQEQIRTLYGGVQLAQNVFAGGANLQKIKEAELQYQAAAELEQRTERSVRVEVKKEWLSLLESLERARVQEAAIEEARLALKSMEERFRQGQASQLELTDTRLALNRVRTNHSQAVFDFWVSLAGLERAAGMAPQEINQ